MATYLARFDDGTRQLVQAVFRAARCPIEDAFAAVPDVCVAARTTLGAETLHRTWLVTCPASQTEGLRRFVAALEPVSSGLEFSRDQAQHDALAAAAGPRVGWMRPGAFRAGGYGLATDYRLHAVVDPLFAAAADHGWTVSYQVTVLRAAQSREDLRWLRKHLLDMELSEHIPAPLLELQRRIVDRVAEATFWIDELIACDEPSWDHAVRLIDEEFGAEMSRYGFADSPFEADHDGLVTDAFVTGLSSLLLGSGDPIARAGASVLADELHAILGWMPQVTPGRLTARVSGAYSVRTDAFISYSHRDDAAATLVCADLEKQGVTCWMGPRDVEIGQAYPEAIMAALRSSRFLVVVLSENSNASRHVQREVERAVSLGKPVLPLRVDRSILGPAMEYLLSTAQWIDTANPPDRESLAILARRALALKAEASGRQ